MLLSLFILLLQLVFIKVPVLALRLGILLNLLISFLDLLLQLSNDYVFILEHAVFGLDQITQFVDIGLSELQLTSQMLFGLPSITASLLNLGFEVSEAAL